MLSIDIHNLMINFHLEYAYEKVKQNDESLPFVTYQSKVLSLFESLTWQEQIHFSIFYSDNLDYEKYLDSDQLAARTLLL